MNAPVLTIVDEIEPCPFCGSSKIGVHGEDHFYSVFKCEDCGAMGPPWKGTGDHDEPAILWNRRPA